MSRSVDPPWDFSEASKIMTNDDRPNQSQKNYGVLYTYSKYPQHGERIYGTGMPRASQTVSPADGTP